MAHLINKDAVLAEIERRIKNLYPKGGQGMVVTKILKDHYEDLLSFIDSLQEEPNISPVFDEGYWERLGEKSASKEIGDYDHKAVDEALHPQLKDKGYRERYKRIAQSEAFKRTHEGRSVGEIMHVEGEECISEIDFGQELYKAFGHIKDFTLCLKIAKWSYDMGKKSRESVSEDLEEACEQLSEDARKHKAETSSPFFSQTDYKQGVMDGAKWQKEHLWKPANGDDLPEYDREVIAILDYDFGHYKVVYAHRPYPNGWNGTNIDTEEKEHFEPVIYDKGGWNQPHVLYWLDTILPYEENKIIKEL